MLPYAALFFDFDYTLGDSTPAIVECARYAMQTMGFPRPGYEAVRKTIGYTLEDTFCMLTGREETHLAADYKRLYVAQADRVMTAKTTLYPAAAPLLKALKKQGIRIGVVTTKFRYRITAILEKFALQGIVDCIVGNEDVQRAKPAPEGLLLAISQAGAKSEQSLYVGDSLVDAQTAAAAGVDFAAVTTGTTTEQDFVAFPHQQIVGDLRGLAEWLHLSI